MHSKRSSSSVPLRTKLRGMACVFCWLLFCQERCGLGLSLMIIEKYRQWQKNHLLDIDRISKKTRDLGQYRHSRRDDYEFYRSVPDLVARTIECTMAL